MTQKRWHPGADWPGQAGAWLLCGGGEQGGEWTVLFFPRSGCLPGLSWRVGGFRDPDRVELCGASLAAFGQPRAEAASLASPQLLHHHQDPRSAPSCLWQLPTRISKSPALLCGMVSCCDSGFISGMLQKWPPVPGTCMLPTPPLGRLTPR